MSLLFRKKPLADLKAQSKQTSLSRSLSAFDLVLLGIGCVVGTGIFVITGTVAATGAGPALILSFVLAGLACRVLLCGIFFIHSDFRQRIYVFICHSRGVSRVFNRMGLNA